MTKLILQIGCPSHHLTSKRKSTLVQKPSAQRTEAFNQHGIAEKTKLFRYELINIANCLASCIGSKQTKIFCFI